MKNIENQISLLPNQRDHFSTILWSSRGSNFLFPIVDIFKLQGEMTSVIKIGKKFKLTKS